ncbi:MAG: tetratricopeptide repeat protein [Ferruginibacter sp.]|nr:tetratricopeptide repeat protein [Ferruginibacter sp.]
MKNKLLILSGSGLILVLVIFFGFRTSNPHHKNLKSGTEARKENNIQTYDIKSFILKNKENLTQSQKTTLINLEAKLGDNRSSDFMAVANFWKDSVAIKEPYIYYLSEAAKLDNSEKNLTFAAQLILNTLRMEEDLSEVDWLSNVAISLFQQAIALNPENDELKVGLGSCYVYGKGRSGDPQQTMKGIQELLAVVRKDSTNMKAQLVLGSGGFFSGQYDKAIARLNKVVAAEPDNLEAVAFLADSYSALGNKNDAIKWYKISKRIANNPAYAEEVDKRIKELEK